MSIKRRFLKQNQAPRYRRHNFGETKWPRITTCNPTRNYTYITGGLNNTSHQVSDQCLEINLKTGGAIPRTKLPEPRFGHAAIMVKE